MKIKTAIISVYDKEGIVEFAKELSDLNVRILSSGGTSRLLKENNIPFTSISDYTGAKEMMDGRVKTLHPKIHGGILALRDNKDHVKAIEDNKIEPIDMVVINLYPFEETISKKDVKLAESLENIDIGGPSMLRSASKNYKDVIVVSSKDQYDDIIRDLKSEGNISQDKRKELARETFALTSRYDSLISDYLNGKEFPDQLTIPLEKLQDLRYGENPHQRAAFYRNPRLNETSVTSSRQLHGKELSYNNILDINAAFELVKDFEKPTAAVIKHTNPSGVASAESIQQAYKKAHEADPMSAFGCVVALNRECDLKTAEMMKPLFIEVVIAPKFEKAAYELLKEKKNLRLLETGPITKSDKGLNQRSVVGGMLLQSRNFPELKVSGLKCVTKREPTKEELDALLFAWRVNKHVKSNSIVLAKEEVTVGIGAGQMSRVDACRIAAEKGSDKVNGSVISSDAFFPFRDGVDEVAEKGITAIIQPGGSIRDQEVIDAANEHDIAMVFSGVRLFKH